MAVSFDLFGTLVDVDYPNDPAEVVARELESRGVDVPDDWHVAYGEVHVDAPAGAEVPLPAHVAQALSSRGVEATENVARHAVVAAFDPDVTRRKGALEAVRTAAERGPVGLLSNCAVPELVSRTLIRAGLRGEFDAVVTSVGCGWRKPHPKAFEAVAEALGVEPAALIHVGDDPTTDGGVVEVGGRFVDVTETPLSALAGELEAEP
ncbi:HAD family hydrolase [Halorubrum vacuolatum]|uniref:Haloacid dehalogenase superfamily, subfamily IA, variant 3 with third motif having DD or ED/haloacid dehalogenase superfamily, subfamily IA, variant 1 with third motif having Dx(3-4)D or Dx(3-4)E n=1 Tax=Halorubrum vacuolatum TaxID=63740 RepID=A0A238XUZ8_HALVU|nr:HAD family hydrolase [Halorubrum vacuolatum]SNR62351.1 haloacid dehalogenase superfamily, subfamily IA, variant 3 with third motif having DD or ED/haloacid dehalogenase superfamily, subfamily IA, variant 1 with third motif having Dx(3-4)D or Dx(3-4)E [Halorubrum vacuolatum]